MPKYGLCDNCQEPSILGYVECSKLWLCPECACAYFNVPSDRAESIKQDLKERYEREKQDVNKA